MEADNKNNKPKITTIDPDEIEKFSKMADDWWNVEGKFKPLHQFNPVRLNYFRRKICDYFKNDQKSLSPFKNLTVIDIGCGGLIPNPIFKSNYHKNILL